jgi:hypothetical protein
MTQTYIKRAYEIESEENRDKATLIVVLKKKVKSNGISNPRYFENARTAKKAKNSLPLQNINYYKPLI